MTEREIIGNFLNIDGYDDFKAEGRHSTLIIALKGARKITGRDIENGCLLNEKMSVEINKELITEGRYYSSLLLGLTNYLIILDLIGSVFTVKTDPKNTKDEIRDALENFSVLMPEEIKAISALRNSLAHNFGLGNTSHIFQLSTEFVNLIELPTIENRWSMGKTKEEKHYTNINEVKLCQLVEDIFKKLVEEFKEENIILKKRMTKERLKTSFTIK